MELPNFKYHPDPIGSDSICESSEICECCGKQTGYRYKGSIYCKGDISSLCPWCIADGSAAKKYDAQFNNFYSDLPDEIVKEVQERTPGFYSFQEQDWLEHCDDACEFYGQALASDLQSLSQSEVNWILENTYLDSEEWEHLKQEHVPDSEPVIYKYVCRKCKEVFVSFDES
ncbi:CbrC family protein [Aliikangiella coralliicola]|uniref:CbrC family protein n=1 Tax=Aliikangiella coralliicola TaxID=2592383 RepID=A0A545UFK3_9GAMM|nr:CbrC family protein [Aliikangiella coralliicola]TQV88247.1 CbrC family protein [Aliikangiella coralliicola]